MYRFFIGLLLAIVTITAYPASEVLRADKDTGEVSPSTVSFPGTVSFTGSVSMTGTVALGTATEMTITSGAITPTAGYVVLQPESGTTDDLVQVNLSAGQVVYLGIADAGTDTITLRPSATLTTTSGQPIAWSTGQLQVIGRGTFAEVIGAAGVSAGDGLTESGGTWSVDADSESGGTLMPVSVTSNGVAIGLGNGMTATGHTLTILPDTTTGGDVVPVSVSANGVGLDTSLLTGNMATATYDADSDGVVDSAADLTIASAATGDLITYDGAAWTNLVPGTATYVLSSQGPGSALAWTTQGGGTTIDDTAGDGDTTVTYSADKVANHHIDTGKDSLAESDDGDVLHVVYGESTDANTKLLIHFDGADTSTTFTDEAARHSLAAGGNTQVDTTNALVGTGAAQFDGTNDDIDVTDNLADFKFGSAAFTIEGKFKLNSGAGSPMIATFGGVNYSFSTSDGMEWMLYYSSNAINFAYNNSGAGEYLSSSAISVEDAAWHTVAVVNTGAALLMFVDGVEVYNGAAISISSVTSVTALRLGLAADNTQDLNGYLDEFRISDTARYTSAYTPTDTSLATITTTYAPSAKQSMYIPPASTADGDMLYGSATTWTVLAPGTTGQFLQGGTTPSWTSYATVATSGAYTDLTGRVTRWSDGGDVDLEAYDGNLVCVAKLDAQDVTDTQLETLNGDLITVVSAGTRMTGKHGFGLNLGWDKKHTLAATNYDYGALFPSNSWTANMWLKASWNSTGTPTRYVVNLGSFFLTLDPPSGGGDFRINTVASSNDTWYMITMIGDGTSAKTYINGSLAHTGTGYTFSDTGDVEFGDSNNSDAAASMLITGFDEFYLWDTILSTDAITALYNAGAGRYWR